MLLNSKWMAWKLCKKDMQEEFIINSVLLWKLCKRTYNMQGYFFITNSAFPSVAGITALHCGRLLVVCNATLNLQPNTLFSKKKKNLKSNLHKTWTITLRRTWTVSCLRNSQQNFFKLLLWKRKLMQLPKSHPLRLKSQPHPFK